MRKRLLSAILTVLLLIGLLTAGPAAHAQSVQAYICANTLKIYASPSASSKTLGTMGYGQTITCSAVSGSWARVVSSGRTGYCRKSGLTTSDPNTLSATVYISANSAKVYKLPSTSSKVLTTVKYASSFTCTAVTKDGKWARLKNGNSYGYAAVSVLSQSDPAKDAYTVYVAANTLPVRKTASDSAKLLGTMSYGESLTCLSVDAGWARVKNSAGSIGYCHAAALSNENTNTLSSRVYINTDGIPVLRRPATGAPVMMRINRNDSYSAVAITPDSQWVRLQNGRYYGYVQAQYVSADIVNDTVQQGVWVSADTLKVYKAASASSKLLGTMAFGENMTLISVDDGWAYVRNSAGATGYCSPTGITTDDPTASSVTIYTQTAGARLYKRPDTASTVLSSFDSGTPLTLLMRSSDSRWAYIVTNGGVYGYMPASSLGSKPDSDGNTFTSVDETEVWVSTLTLPVYRSADSASSILGTMSFGESLTLTGTSGEWAMVRNSAGKTGYCRIASLTKTDPNKYSLTLYIQSSGTVLYSKPMTTASKLATLSLNTTVTGIAVSTDSKWARVTYGSLCGYIPSEKLSSNMAAANGVSAKATKVLQLAAAQLDKPYVYGASGPDKFDCSGFTRYVFSNAVGITLKRTAYQQGYNDSYTKIASVSALQAGDLVFFNTSTDDDLCDHAGIYIGGGYFIHASSAGGAVIKSSLTSGYYSRVFSWGRRVL